MRTILLCLLLCARAALAGSYFMDANEAYAAGKFKEAMDGYQKMQDGSPKPRADLFFNFGNAAYRADEPGRAALAYERALLVKPDHPEAQANLKFLRGKLSSHVDERSWVDRGLRLAMQPAAAGLAIVVAWLGFCLVGYTVLRRSGGWARWLGVTLILLGALAGGGLQMSRQEVQRVALVTAKSIDARTEPADRAALAEALPAGSWVRILSEQGGWTYCELPGGGRGWLPAKSIERLLPPGFI